MAIDKRLEEIRERAKKAKGCYCVCHSSSSSRPSCVHCHPEMFVDQRDRYAQMNAGEAEAWGMTIPYLLRELADVSGKLEQAQNRILDLKSEVTGERDKALAAQGNLEASESRQRVLEQALRQIAELSNECIESHDLPYGNTLEINKLAESALAQGEPARTEEK